MFGFGKPTSLPTPDQALPGRSESMWSLGDHVVLDAPVITPDAPAGFEVAILGLGDSPIPEVIGRLAAVAIASIVVGMAIAAVSQGPALWIASFAMLVALALWMASLATTFGERAATA